ncbi:MAG: hypothetical protein QGI83_09985 [Candidatus Latescibacteria bacterium]|jgi:hypothetical protein|nr:hypothetical protein [Candidatus Latescibacterota bacterium]
MTNTLHRQGSPESLRRDYVVFSTVANGHNDQGAEEKKREFLRMAARHGPVNTAIVQEPEVVNEGAKWVWNSLAPPTVAVDQALEKFTGSAHATATFDNLDAVRGFVEELIRADMGISINISGPLDEVGSCCRELGRKRHSAEHSLGVFGKKERLPSNQVLEISTMCGHGMVAFGLITKIIDYIRLGILTPEEGAAYLARPCTCGAFNPSRAAELLESAHVEGGGSPSAPS